MHPKHWRYVLHTTEEFIKEGQPWLINEKKKETEEGEKGKKKKEQQEKVGEQQQQQKEQEEGGSDGSGKKPAESGQEGPDQGDEEDSKKPKYTPEQQALLAYLKQEAEYMQSLKSNDGKGRSPAGSSSVPGEIDEADQFTPDNWVPRTDHLIRLTEIGRAHV